MKDKPLICPVCGKPMTDDYVLIDVKRIKDGFPYFMEPVMGCIDCYRQTYIYDQEMRRNIG